MWQTAAALGAMHISLYWMFAILWSPQLPCRSGLCRVLANQVAVMPITFVVFHAVTPRVVCAGSSAWVLAPLVTDAWFYSAHRSAHVVPWLYKNIHRYHHVHVTPVAWAAIDAHPIEHALCNLAAVLVPMFLFNMSFRLQLLWVAVATFDSVRSHTVFDASRPSTHAIHHAVLTCNFGAGGLMDSVFKTARNRVVL